jgi:hypothetical protein
MSSERRQHALDSEQAIVLISLVQCSIVIAFVDRKIKSRGRRQLDCRDRVFERVITSDRKGEPTIASTKRRHLRKLRSPAEAGLLVAGL